MPAAQEGIGQSLHVLSDVGHRREHNEDCGVALDLRIASEQDRSLLLLAVADGVGGSQAGEVASRMAVQGVIYALQARVTAADSGAFDAASVLAEGFRIANRALVQGSRESPDLQGMSTTMTAALLEGNTLTVGHVGDTRAYVIGRRGLIRLTKDHSVVQAKVDAGVLTAEEARSSSERNQLTRAVGVDDDLKCDISAEAVLPGDTILLCSDGLHNSISDTELRSEVLCRATAKDVCDALVNRALQLDGTDNITVVCKKTSSAHSVRAGRAARASSGMSRRSLLAVLLIAVLAAIGYVAQRIAELGSRKRGGEERTAGRNRTN